MRLDIGWTDLIGAALPTLRRRAVLEEAIANHAPDGSHPVVALSVRTIYDALLAETGKSPVVMSAANLDSMAELVRVSGRQLHTVDLDPQTLLPAPKQLQETCERVGAGLVVIAQLFGSRAESSAYGATAGPGRILIEDCAQAFDGRLRLGRAMDVSLYSFGPIKVASALGGAIGLFRDRELAARVRARVAQYEPLSELWFLRRVAKHAALKFMSLAPVYGAVVAALQLARRDPDQAIGELGHSFAKNKPVITVVRRSPPRGMLALLGHRLATWRPRADAAQVLYAHLRGQVGLPAPGPHRWWLAPVFVRDPAELIAKLRRAGFDATTGTSTVLAIRDSTDQVQPAAKSMFDQIVYLPKPPDPATAIALARCVLRAVGESGGVLEEVESCS